MKQERTFSHFVAAGSLTLLLMAAAGNSGHAQVQDNPVLAPDVTVLPDIDGIGNDSCWQDVPWQSIGEVWIPYGAKVAPEDYSGHYKVVWSSRTSLLYFLIEVTDDVIVDDFVPGVTSDVYNFDIAEVFIDEDKSGGLHVFDGTGETAKQYGTKAANAFAYHIFARYPSDGGVTTSFHAYDLAGTSWSDARTVDYASHFPSFALRRNGHTAVWEFSLIVCKDTYTDSTKEAARAKLYAGKVMGLSLAYCDNDDPSKSPKVRDNFFGSVYVPPAAYNDHWLNADYFGTIKLCGSVPKTK